MTLFTWVLDSCLWKIFFFICGQWNYKAWEFQFWLFPSNVTRPWMRALHLHWGRLLFQNLIHCNPKSKCVSQTTRLPRILVFMTKLSDQFSHLHLCCCQEGTHLQVSSSIRQQMVLYWAFLLQIASGFINVYLVQWPRSWLPTTL